MSFSASAPAGRDIIRRRGTLGLTLAMLITIGGPAIGVPAAVDDIPGVPTGVVAVPGNNTAQVVWTPPVGADPLLTSYQVTANPGGQAVTVPGSETSATVRFLTNGTPYTFRVLAFTFDDTGPLSLPSSAVIPLNVCTVIGTLGDDVLTGTSGNDAICGLRGNDTLIGMGGGDTFVGGPGVDTVDFSGASGPVYVNLPGVPWIVTTQGLGWANGQGSDVLRADIESLKGSPYADVLEGDDNANTLAGGGGNDLIRGWAGNDLIDGQAGNDTLWGQSGDDTINGGGGKDTMLPLGDTDVVNGGVGTDTVTYTRSVTVDLAAGTAQGVSTDSLFAVENVNGSPEADTLHGSSAVNVLRGGDGNDSLSGRGANDKLYGDEGDDAMVGGAGTADLCDGGLGVDTATTCETLAFVP